MLAQRFDSASSAVKRCVKYVTTIIQRLSTTVVPIKLQTGIISFKIPDGHRLAHRTTIWSNKISIWSPPRPCPKNPTPLINSKELPGPRDKHLYKQCTAHSLTMDQFCYPHCSVICRQCRYEAHQDCSVKDVEQVCLELDHTTVGELRKSLNKIRVDAIEVNTIIGRNVSDLEKQKQSMMKKLKKAHEDVLKEVNRKYEETKSEIERQNKKYTSELSAYICHINSILEGLDMCLKDTRPLEGRHMEVGVFLKYQDILSSNSQIPSDLQNLYNKIRKVKVSFKENKRFQPLMEKSVIGNINEITTKYNAINPHQEINCPLFVSQPVLIRKNNYIAGATTKNYTPLNPHQEINCPSFVSQPVLIRKDNSVTGATTTKHTSVNPQQQINCPSFVSQPALIRENNSAAAIARTKYTFLKPHQEINCSSFISQPVLFREDNTISMATAKNYTSQKSHQEITRPLFVFQPVLIREDNSVAAATTTSYTSLNSHKKPLHCPLHISQPVVIRGDNTVAPSTTTSYTSLNSHEESLHCPLPISQPVLIRGDNTIAPSTTISYTSLNSYEESLHCPLPISQPVLIRGDNTIAPSTTTSYTSLNSQEESLHCPLPTSQPVVIRGGNTIAPSTKTSYTSLNSHEESLHYPLPISQPLVIRGDNTIAPSTTTSYTSLNSHEESLHCPLPISEPIVIRGDNTIAPSTTTSYTSLNSYEESLHCPLPISQPVLIRGDNTIAPSTTTSYTSLNSHEESLHCPLHISQPVVIRGDNTIAASTTTSYTSPNSHEESLHCPLPISQPVVIRGDNTIAASTTTSYTSLNSHEESLHCPLPISQPVLIREDNSVAATTTTKHASLNHHQEISGPLFLSQPVVVRGDKPVAAATSLCSNADPYENGCSISNETYQYVKAVKDRDLDIQNCNDDYDCFIRGLDVTLDGRLLMVDFNNDKIKMLTADRQRLLQLESNEKCWDITVYNDTTAVAAGYHDIFFIDISEGSLAVTKTVSVDYYIYGIQACGNNLLVICEDGDAVQSVKLITTAGEALWSVSQDQTGHDLFLFPYYITCYRDQIQCRVVVTDRVKDCITVLDGDTGDVIKVITVKGKQPRGVTSDNNGNFYICYHGSEEVVTWNKDMTSCRLLFTTRVFLNAVRYDSFRNQLIVSFAYSNKVECYQLE